MPDQDSSQINRPPLWMIPIRILGFVLFLVTFALVGILLLPAMGADYVLGPWQKGEFSLANGLIGVADGLGEWMGLFDW